MLELRNAVMDLEKLTGAVKSRAQQDSLLRAGFVSLFHQAQLG